MGYILVTNAELILILNTINDDDHFLGKCVRVQIKGLTKNGNNWRLKLRIPTKLLPLYGGKTHLTHSLKTDDKSKAEKKAVIVLNKWEKDFKEQIVSMKRQAGIGGGTAPIPKAILEVTSERWSGAEDLLLDDIKDRYQTELTKRAKGDLVLAGWLDDEGVLDPFEMATPAEHWHLRNKGLISGGQRLSDALRVYLETYPKNASKVTGIATRSMESLIKVVGKDLPLGELRRQHLKKWITYSGDKLGHSTGTTKRQLNAIKAVLRRASVEFEVSLGNALEMLTIPNLGNDAKERHSPSIKETRKVLEVFKDDPLMTLIVLYGGRISEIAGLRMQDVFLELDHPYLAIVPHEARTLKTKNSKRDFPLIGKALKAVTKLVTVGDPKREALLPQYFGGRGGDNLGGLVKRRLTRAGYPHITSHCFRHGFKDLLREALVPAEIGDAIQGHGRLTESDKYGSGYRLEPLSNGLTKAYRLIDAL